MRLLLPTALLVALLTSCSSGTPDADPAATKAPTIAGVEVFNGLSHTHLVHKIDYPHTYPQTPPVGGPHSPAWLRCDVYAQPVPNENAVHSMEHGGIWITYQPGLPAADVQHLTDLEGTNTEYVLVSPYPGLPAKVVITTWGLQLKVDSAQDPRLEQFIQAYAGGGQGGEAGYPCRKQGITPDQESQVIAQLK